MKDLLKILAAAIVGAGIYLVGVGTQLQDTAVGGVPNVPSYQTASSTVYTIGDDISTKVLDTRSGRGYALFCNKGGYHAYLSFSSTAVTATTSADATVDVGECYEINSLNLYVGEVQAIQDTGSTTATFIVTELLGN